MRSSIHDNLGERLGIVRHRGTRALPFLVLAVALLVAGCGAARAAAPTSSPTPAPVQVTLTLTQAGKVAEGTLSVTATVTVTNHQAEAIAFVSPCGYAFHPPHIVLDLFVPPSTLILWRNSGPGHDPFCTQQDYTTIAAGGSQSWTVPVDLSNVPAKDRVAGATYRVTASMLWHTGSLPQDVVEAQKILHEADAQAEITVT